LGIKWKISRTIRRGTPLKVILVRKGNPTDVEPQLWREWKEKF